ncbi:MAG: hypothetical protein EBY49_04550, partial [Actinobacteria bacterium]|nr:hypothetical protein [Actinomycetota bacterium]
MTTTPIKRSVAITAIAASTLGGVAAGAAFFTPMIAGAQDDVVEAEGAAGRLEVASDELALAVHRDVGLALAREFLHLVHLVRLR